VQQLFFLPTKSGSHPAFVPEPEQQVFGAIGQWQNVFPGAAQEYFR
jgi:hypothetical protein